MKNYKYLLLMITACLTSCGKEFLEVKQDKSQVVPKSIRDLQALLDDATNTINFYSCNELGLIGSDDYFVSDQAWTNLPAHAKPYERKGYFWAKENVYENLGVRDWDYTYKKILMANTALEGIEKINPSSAEQAAWNNVKGSALFIRAFAFYQLAQEFCLPYHTQTSGKDLGIPLRLKSDITAKVPRATISQTYQQIITDLNAASVLLPDLPLINYRPSKPSAYAVLARAYLQMDNYIEAGKNADLCLSIKNNLIDFNAIDVNANYCFPLTMQSNPEIIYAGYISNIPILQTTRLRIDPDLYASYADDDLGRNAYFIKQTDETISFKGSYYGMVTPLFTGLAVDEVFLMRAECYARTGELTAALADLNHLMTNRYDVKTFKALNITDKEALLDAILEQRRKRLILRGTRWEDLRRLNKEDRHKKKLIRILKGVQHELLPGDARYTWPIPEKAIELGGYPQNDR